MSEIGAEIVKTEETKESGVKYLNINVSNSEVERDPDIVRLCADAGILEYMKPKTDHCKEFIEIIVDYPPAELCIYPEYKGKPYYNIKYRENDKEYVGFGTYNPEVLSQYLKEYFMSDTQPKTGHWINAKVGRLFPSNDFKCSECGNILDFSGVNCGRGDANYCPNCGAKMVDPQEGSES